MVYSESKHRVVFRVKRHYLRTQYVVEGIFLTPSQHACCLRGRLFLSNHFVFELNVFQRVDKFRCVRAFRHTRGGGERQLEDQVVVERAGAENTVVSQDLVVQHVFAAVDSA